MKNAKKKVITTTGKFPSLLDIFFLKKVQKNHIWWKLKIV